MSIAPVIASHREDPLEPVLLTLEEATAAVTTNREAARLTRMLLELLHVLGDDRIVDWIEVVRRTNLSRRTIQRLMDESQFPQRVLLSGCRSGWRNSEIEHWIRTRPRFVEPKRQ